MLNEENIVCYHISNEKPSFLLLLMGLHCNSSCQEQCICIFSLRSCFCLLLRPFALSSLPITRCLFLLSDSNASFDRFFRIVQLFLTIHALSLLLHVKLLGCFLLEITFRTLAHSLPIPEACSALIIRPPPPP